MKTFVIVFHIPSWIFTRFLLTWSQDVIFLMKQFICKTFFLHVFLSILWLNWCFVSTERFFQAIFAIQHLKEMAL